MRVVHVSFGDGRGGAFRSAHRIHTCVRRLGIESTMLVAEKSTDDPTVSEIRPGTNWKMRRRAGRWLSRLLPGPLEDKAEYRTTGLIPSSCSELPVLRSGAIVHLHWVGNEMMSVRDLGRIPQPAVWTLQDMWPFCGAEHYSSAGRHLTGYADTGRTLPDLDRIVWTLKKKHWRRPMNMVAISDWMAGQMRQSTLMADWPVDVIPLPLDTETWVPVPKAEARRELGLDIEVPVVAFGAIASTTDRRKGFDLLIEALRRLSPGESAPVFLVFGNTGGPVDEIAGFRTHAVGHVGDDAALRRIYSAADVMVVPSRIEAFGQTASEAMACGTPVAAFADTGVADVLGAEGPGYLAKQFEPGDLALGIERLLDQQVRHRLTGGDEPSPLSHAARTRAEQAFSYDRVGQMYADLYRRIWTASSRV